MSSSNGPVYIKENEKWEGNIDKEEGYDGYRLGGYHPTRVGDLINQKYIIERKLGWGHYSTVWLVSNINNKNDFKALKIQKSAENYTNAALDEIKFYKKLKHKNIIELHDVFYIHGPNGKHICLLFEYMANDLLSLIKKYKYKGIPVELVKKITLETLHGLSNLHQHEIIHTDIKPENILISLPTKFNAEKLKNERVQVQQRRQNIEQMKLNKNQKRRAKVKALKQQAKAEAKQAIEQPSAPTNDELHGLKKNLNTEFLEHKDQKVWDFELNDDNNDGYDYLAHLDYIQVKIGDLGTACWNYNHITDDVTTRQYRSPEVICGYQYDEAIDIWSIACVIFELLTGDFLFEPHQDQNITKTEDHLSLMMELLGTFPKALYLKAKRYFNNHGQLKKIRHISTFSLQQVFIKDYKYNEYKARQISNFLLPMLALHPKNRATVAQVLQSEWLTIKINFFIFFFFFFF